MSTPNDTDLFLVERSGVQYQLSYEDMSTLNEDDLLLVERSGTQYKIEAQYVSTGPTGYFDAPVEVLTPLNGAGLNEGESYEPFSTAIVSESGGVITFTDDTELENIIGTVKMVDANGDVKTPQTSAIVSVVDTSQTVALTSTVDPVSPSWESGQPADMFDGSTSTQYGVNGSVAGAGGSFFLDFDLIDDFTDGTNYGKTIVFEWGSNTSGTDQKIQIQYQDNTPDTETNNGGANGTSTLTLANAPVDKIRVIDTNNYPYNATISEVRLDGVALVGNYVSGAGQLVTFTDDSDLQFLKAGDTVTAPASTTATAAFSATTYTGNGASDRSITTGIDNTGKALIWAKDRDAGNNHRLFDTVRGVELSLSSNTPLGQSTETNGITAFNSNGFTTGGSSGTNDNGSDIVAWNFRAAPGFMDIVTFEGDGTANRQISHGLGSEPGLIICKSTSHATSWAVRHNSIPSKLLILNSGNGESSAQDLAGTNTANYFNVSYSSGYVNTNGRDYVAYLFADTSGLIKCGSFTTTSGNPTVTTGFRPGWVMYKAVINGDWTIFDSARDWNKELYANEPDSESSAGASITSVTETGFTLTGAANANYVYVAIKDGATAGSFDATATVLTDADPTAKTMVVDAPLAVGKTLTGPVLDTEATTVTSQTGSTLTVSGVTGDWRAGLFAEGATISRSAPSASEIVFTTSNNGTTPVTGLDVTLSRRFWTLQSSSSSSGPWTTVGTYEDTAANSGQDGSTPWSTHPTLAADTFYQVKVRYDSANADAVESSFNTFKTAP